MTADQLATLVAARCQPRAKPLRLPAETDWSALEANFGCKFPPLFYELHRLYSLYRFFGEWLPVAANINPLSPDTPALVAEVERETGRPWDDTLVPINDVPTEREAARYRSTTSQRADQPHPFVTPMVLTDCWCGFACWSDNPF